jgi:hypothetical protein
MTTLQPDAETITTQTLSSNELVDELIKETNSCVDVVETVISSLQQNDSAMVNHTNGSYLWKFQYGSVEVFVQLTGLTNEDTFTAWASVLKFPVKDEAKLMRKLLEMNWSQTFEAHFAIFGEQVVVVSTRSVEELSPSEISRIITVVATIADDNDDALQADFATA